MFSWLFSGCVVCLVLHHIPCTFPPPRRPRQSYRRLPAEVAVRSVQWLVAHHGCRLVSCPLVVVSPFLLFPVLWHGPFTLLLS